MLETQNTLSTQYAENRSAEVQTLDNQKSELISDEMSETIISCAERLVLNSGTNTITVRKILNELSITNRVFYNRFHNIEEVLSIVYRNTIMKIRESITPKYDIETDFFEHVKDVVVNSLVMSYDTKMKFNQYVFENDSVSQSNYEWWIGEIKKLIEYAKEHKLIKNVDSDRMSYAIWCFCRGFNADAVGRGLPKDEAIKSFRYSFGILLDGMKYTDRENDN